MSTFLDEVLAELSRARGIDLSGYRPAMLHRRLDGRLAQLGIREPAEYVRRLKNEPGELDKFIEAITINVSSFFRTPVMWEILAQTILPSIVQAKRLSKRQEIRVWSAGCAGGEEPYSLAILLHEFLKGEVDSWKVHIFATDLSEDALRTAAKGVYAKEQLVNTRLGLLDAYFSRQDDAYEVDPRIRRMVWFSRDDLTSERTVAPAESVFGTFDLVLCRNVLIYFSPELQLRVLDKLTRVMCRGGYLVLGESEGLRHGRDSGLIPVNRRNRIYQKNGGAVPLPRAELTDA